MAERKKTSRNPEPGRADSASTGRARRKSAKPARRGDAQASFAFDAEATVPPAEATVSRVNAVLPKIAPLAARLHKLAARGVYLGTSSWKYAGWLGQVYDPSRYATRGRFSERKFEQECLTEYAGVFPAVGGDFSFYQFPSTEYWHKLFDQVPTGFAFGLKVPEEITAERYPKHARYGDRAGQDNPQFMDADVLREMFLDRIAPHRDRLGPVMFEFGKVYRGPLSKAGVFTERLDGLLRRLPTDRFRFAVEVRNRGFLEDSDEYLSCLRAHGVAHCFNSWTQMPPVEEQLANPRCFTAPHATARFLLRPGRTYEEAVKMFEPYESIQDPYPEGRSALTALIDKCLAEKRTLFAFVNNRFEGNAPQTIELALDALACEGS